MKKLNPQWGKAIGEAVNASPYFSLQSMRIVELAWATARVEIPVQEKHLQPFGNVHGGVFSTLVDAAGFWAAYTQIPPQVLGMTTVELKLNYLAPAQQGTLVGLGRCLRLGRTLALAEARIEDQQGQLLAYGTVTVMVLPQVTLLQIPDMPPKFLDD